MSASSIHPKFAAVALTALVAACAEPAPPATVAEPPAVAAAGEEKPFKKKPRLHNRGEVTSISFERFFDLHQAGRVMVFDARPGYLYALGRIPGAINLTKYNCDRKINGMEAQIRQALDEGKVLVTYCSGPGCPDARTVARHLSGFGYSASVFGGGWDAWRAAGMPTE